MNKILALQALAKIDAIVYQSSIERLNGTQITRLTCAQEELVEAVRGDNYSEKRAEWIRELIVLGFLGSDSHPSKHRQEILGEGRALSRHIDSFPGLS
jgi:hypothetical protein